MAYSELEAYSAMFYFLVDYYERTKADDIGALLGGLRILEDGLPADPAAWEDWMKSLSKAKEYL